MRWRRPGRESFAFTRPVQGAEHEEIVYDKTASPDEPLPDFVGTMR